jgi:hypothetical protein
MWIAVDRTVTPEPLDHNGRLGAITSLAGISSAALAARIALTREMPSGFEPETYPYESPVDCDARFGDGSQGPSSGVTATAPAPRHTLKSASNTWKSVLDT